MWSSYYPPSMREVLRMNRAPGVCGWVGIAAGPRRSTGTDRLSRNAKQTSSRRAVTITVRTKLPDESPESGCSASASR